MILLVISVFIKGFLALGATVLVLFLIHCALMPKEEEFTAQSVEMPIVTPSDSENADIPSVFINKCILPINNKEIIDDNKFTADEYNETAYEYKVIVNNYKETVNECKEAVKYKVNDSVFVDEFKQDDSLVEFEIFAEEVTMSEMDLDYDMYCESPPGSVQSDCEEDTQPLAVTLQEVPHGYIINLTLYLTEHQWHTLIFIDTKSTRCVVCDVYCEIDTCSEHIGTDGHRRNLDKHPPLRRFDLSITRKIRQNYHCAVCNELFHVSDNMDHFGSNMHEGKFLFAINKASDLSFDNDLFDKNETNYKKQVEAPKDMSYKFINFQNNYDNFEDDFEIFEPPQPGVSYANMAKTPKVNTQQFIHVDLGNKRVRVRFDSWHMVICPELNRFYCMVCKMFDHVRLKALHCSKADHLKRLELCKVVEAYEEYFIRMVDDKLYHCGHCNNLQLIHEMNDHVETSHPRKTKIITEKVQKTPLKSQESTKENINTINVNRKLNYDSVNTNSGNKNVINENRNMISDIRNTFSQNRNTIIDNRNATFANRNTTIDNSENRNVFSGNRNTTVDNRNMISENRNTTVDNRNMNSENRNTTVDNRNVFSENRNATVDNRNISDNRNTNVDNRNVISDNRTVVSGNRNATIENRNVNSDNRNMIVENRNVNDIKNANVAMFKTNLQQNGQCFSKMAGIFDSTVIYPFGSKLSIPMLSYNVINKRQTDFYCGICIFVCSEDLVLSHIYEMRHIEMLQRTPFISPFNCHLIRAIRDSLHCAICNMSLPAHKIYKHIEELQHLNLLKKAMSADPNPPQQLSPFKIQNTQTNVVGNVNSLRDDLNKASRTSEARPSHVQIPYNIQNAQTNVVFRKEDINSQKEDINKASTTSDARPSHVQIPYNIQNAQTNVFRKEDINSQKEDLNKASRTSDARSSNVQMPYNILNAQTNVVFRKEDIHSQKEDINKASEARPSHVQIPYTIPNTQGYVIRKEGIYSPKEDLTKASRMVEAKSSHVPYINQNAQVNVFKIEGLHYPKEGINSPKEDLNKAPKIFDQYNINVQENATVKTEVDTPKKSLKNTKQDLDTSIDSVDLDYATFELEEYVYLKLKNTYIKITNTSYNTLVHVGDGSRYCFVCSIQVDFVVLQKHVDSRSHLENMEKYRFLEKYENHLLRQIYLMYHCSVCNVIITKREVKTHLTWPTHYLQNENTIKNIKKQRKNDIKGGIKQIVVSTQKENIFVNEKETKIKIGLNVVVTKMAEPKMRKLKIIIVDENVLKVPWESWHGVSKIKNGYKCILCQLELGTSEIETHCVSEWHVSGLDKTFEKQYGSALIRKINDLTLNCLVCNTEVASREDLIIEHISGKKHDKNYEAVLKISSTYNTYTDCDDDVFTV